MTHNLLKLVVMKNERYVELKTTPKVHPDIELRTQKFRAYQNIVS